MVRKHLGIICILYIGLFALLAGCSHNNNDAIRFGLASMPSNLDPRYYTGAAATRIGRLIYDRLVDFDEAMMAKPDLADWQEITPKLYRFTLTDENRRFHDGSALTSADVRATYEYILDKKNASPHRASVALIEHIKTPDKRTIDFHLKQADPLFPAYLVIGILPKPLIENGHEFESKPIGSGPFEFVDWQSEGQLTLQRRNDKKHFQFLHVKNPTVRVLKLMRGEIDMIQNDLPPELVTFLADKNEVVINQRKGSNFAYLGFNMEDPLLQNINVRKAIAHAIDKQAIMNHVFGGSVSPANALLPPEHWAGHAKLDAYEFNLDKARAYLEQAGVNGKQIHLSYKTSNDPFRVRLATILQDQLSRVGISVDIRSYDWGTFYGDIKAGRFQIFSLAWVGIKTPDIFRYVFHSDAVPPNGANRGRFSDSEIDTLIEAAVQETNLDRQAQLYSEIQQQLLEKLPYIPLWYEDHVFISRKDIKNYEVATDGNFDGLKTVTRS